MPSLLADPPTITLFFPYDHFPMIVSTLPLHPQPHSFSSDESVWIHY